MKWNNADVESISSIDAVSTIPPRTSVRKFRKRKWLEKSGNGNTATKIWGRQTVTFQNGWFMWRGSQFLSTCCKALFPITQKRTSKTANPISACWRCGPELNWTIMYESMQYPPSTTKTLTIQKFRGRFTSINTNRSYKKIITNIQNNMYGE